jgi:small subunit ribosomal protein S5
MSKRSNRSNKSKKPSNKFNVDNWEPKTELGQKVKEGTITDIDQILDKGLPIMELEIVDILLPDLEEEVMDVNLVQRMHKSGRKVNFRVIVAVGNKNGYVGLGEGKSQEVGPAIRKAVDNAKYNLINVRRGCGDWGCVCGRKHTVPFKVQGKMSSVNVTLIPAPGGVGLAIGDVGKTILSLAGIDDVWSRTSGQTQTTINFAGAVFDALKELSSVKTSEKDLKTLGVIE